jgi:hypothetical protein
MTTRILWALSLALGAMISGIGMELHFAGAGAVRSYPLVAAGFLFLPLAAAAIERLTAPASSD